VATVRLAALCVNNTDAVLDSQDQGLGLEALEDKR